MKYHLHTSTLHSILLFVTISWLSANQCTALPTNAYNRDDVRQRRDVDVTSTKSPLDVSIYYEALCPFSRQLIMDAYPVVQQFLQSGLVNLNLVPWGKSSEKEEGGSYLFQCPHGPDECNGNMITTCAMHHLKDPSVYFPFARCIEYYAYKVPTNTSAKECAKTLSIDYSPIEACATGPEGTILQHEMAAKTKALNPVVATVPWVTLNGVHTDAIQHGLTADMASYICQTLSYGAGGSKPEACTARSVAESGGDLTQRTMAGLKALGYA